MTRKQKTQIKSAIVIAIGLLLWSTMANAQEDETFYYGFEIAPEDGIAGTVIDDNIWVFKIDQNKFSFRVKGNNLNPKSLPEWTKYEAGGINLNMFEAGNIPMGYTKLEGRVIQPKLRKDYNGFMVWDKDTLLILDRYKDGLKTIMKWPNISQNIRTIIEDGKRNTWQIDKKRWSVAMIATTTDGHVLFIHSREPYTMHAFIDILLKEDSLKIHRAIYAEGGPEASIAIHGQFTHPLTHLQRMGSYEDGYYPYYDNESWYSLPWVLVFN